MNTYFTSIYNGVITYMCVIIYYIFYHLFVWYGYLPGWLSEKLVTLLVEKWNPGLKEKKMHQSAFAM